ncbi:hypothetical protein EBT16_05310 [bacterium]|nr:hypothetical protein [bacterium]
MDEQDIQLDPFAKSIEEEQAAQKALLSRYQQLQNSLQQRTNLPFNPTLMRISQALLSPTKSGSFGESLGMGVQALVEGSEQEQLRQQNLAKMQAELEEKVLGIKQKGRQLQTIKQYAGYGAPATTQATATKPTAPSEAPVEGAPTASTPAESTAPAQPGVTPKPAGAQTPSQTPAVTSTFDNFIDKSGVQFAQPNPYYLQTDEQIRNSVTRRLYSSGVSDMNEIEKEIQQEKKNIREKRYEIKDGVITDYGLGKAAPISKSALAGEEAEAKKLGEGSGERTNAFIESASAAPERAAAAEALIDYSTSNPNAFGQLASKGAKNAFLTFLRDGVSAGQFGQIGFKSLEEAIRKANPETSDADINTALMAASYASQIELAYSKMYLKGQGAVTENERAIVRAIGPSVTDSPKVVEQKAKLIKLGADRETALYDAFQKFQDAGGHSIDKFRRTQDYTDIMKDFNDQAKVLRDEFIKSGGKSTSASSGAVSPKPSGGLSADAIKAEIERRKKGIQ